MKKTNIRSKVAKDALVDASNLAKSLKENTEQTVKKLLSETVRNEFRNAINEKIEDDEDDEDYDVTDSEVEDTQNDDSQEESNDLNADTDAEDADTDNDLEIEPDGDADDANVEDAEMETEPDDENGDEESEGMNDFDKYKVSDNEYDFTNADDDEIVKVYKLLKNDDQVMVTKADDKVNIKDNETGAEYLIDLGDDTEDDETENDLIDDSDFDTEEEPEDMKESKIYEINLNEYNSNVGYTDDYQNQDVATNDGVNEPAPGKVNDWDKGTPHDTKKPWANPNKKAAPFDKNSAQKVEEAVSEAVSSLMDEARGGKVKNRTTAKNFGDGGGKPYGTRHHSAHGKFNVVEPDGKDSSTVSESIKRIYTKANSIMKENNELKAVLGNFKQMIAEAALTNINLGNIVKILTENTTTSDEKKNIISRFANEATTVKSSKNLYESISNELKTKKPIIKEAKIDEQLSVNGSKQINETTN